MFEFRNMTFPALYIIFLWESVVVMVVVVVVVDERRNDFYEVMCVRIVYITNHYCHKS